MGSRRYNGGATRCSTAEPKRASRCESTICHISAWTWCRKTIRGRRAHSGEKKGIPFQISTTPSPEPIVRENPRATVRGNTA